MIPEEGGPVYLLSIKTGTVGGSLITRSNIWTTLGLEKSVFVRGGLTASWRLINGRDGTVKAAGTVRCGSQATSFDAVHTAAAASNNCT
jgi:hypothetical protein